MRPSLAAVLPALLLAGLGGPALGGCGSEDAELPIDRLESEVAALYPAADERVRVDVRCAGPLAAEVGATQDCRVAVRRDLATVRATVVEQTDAGPVFETAPVLPADQVARTVLDGLTREEYVVGEVVCESELVGVVGESVACTATPPDGGRPTPVEASVRAVEGLDVRLRYRLVG